MQAVTVGGVAITLSYNNVVLDSGSSLNYIPSSDYTQLYSAITRNGANKCSKDASSGITYCSCTTVADSNYPNITLKMGNQFIFYFNNTDYLVYDTSRKLCILTFLQDTSSSTKFWLMGDPFMRAYYIVHDMDNLKVGMAGPNIDLGPPASTSSSDSSGSSSSDGVGSISDAWDQYGMYIVIALGCVLGLIILMCICCKLCKSKPQTTSKVQTFK